MNSELHAFIIVVLSWKMQMWEKFSNTCIIDFCMMVFLEVIFWNSGYNSYLNIIKNIFH